MLLPAYDGGISVTTGTGACVALGGNIVTDAFGVVAMVAMTPLITIQVMGLYSKLAEKKKTAAVMRLPMPSTCWMTMQSLSCNMRGERVLQRWQHGEAGRKQRI